MYTNIGSVPTENMTTKLDKILHTAEKGNGLNNQEIRFLLDLEEKEQVEALFATARDLRSRFFGNKIFLYGFLYISTFCRNNCHFCFYRKSNQDSVRYRKDKDDIVSAARELAQTGVHLIDLTMGEDPELLIPDGQGNDWLMDVVGSVRAATGLPVMVSPGLVPEEMLVRMVDEGVSWYACYQETHNQSLFKRLRPGQSYEDRLQGKIVAHSLGLLFEEGLLAGVGESRDDIADSIDMMRRLDADQVLVDKPMTHSRSRRLGILVHHQHVPPGFACQIGHLNTHGRLLTAGSLSRTCCGGGHAPGPAGPPDSGLFGCGWSWWA